MSKTRNNHYVPRWYQKGFFEPDQNTLAYLDTTPSQHTLKDGRVVTEKSLFDAPTSRAFQEQDLYSTFFGTSVNDEIERRLFGAIDARGSNAIKAFAGTDVSEWHDHFRTLFEYIDIQKVRTPKGLDWLKTQYPTLTQNELMYEMQGIRMMHCTIWGEGVREIVSAEEADVKFIVSDHPVTVYNYAAAPDGKACVYPNDPTIALKASQTVFPLNREFCLILTNLEYARDPTTDPLEKRTFARNFRNSMVRTDAFIRSRKLSSQEVVWINHILKARARRYVAAGRKEWLYPEQSVSDSWDDLRTVLLPPNDELWRFGGEIYAKYDSGHVHYQDAFGRTEKQRDFLKKDPPSKPPRPGDPCGCGSGRRFKDCCKPKPIALRPSWNEPSIRERNMMLLNGVINVLDLESGKDWVDVRRDLTDEQISRIYLIYQALWPLETDLLKLLPKPDGDGRAIYTGYIHPETIMNFALGASLYFGEVIIQNPFLHAGTVKKEFSPVENPKIYRQEFLKTVFFFLNVMPLVEIGLVNLIPDPCDFDFHLRNQMFQMAKSRTSGMSFDELKETNIEQYAKEDFKRGIMSLPKEDLRSQLVSAMPELDEKSVEETVRYIEKLREHDPLAVLQDDSWAGGKEGGQFSVMKLAPNFELTMYLAQATGACIVTDSRVRWTEITKTIRQKHLGPHAALATLALNIESSEFEFLQSVLDIAMFGVDDRLVAYPKLFRDSFKYLSRLDSRGPRPNREAQLAGRFAKMHARTQDEIIKAGVPTKRAQMSCVFPSGGIQDNTVNRLLLMSSSEWHLPAVPMAFFMGARSPSESFDGDDSR